MALTISQVPDLLDSVRSVPMGIEQTQAYHNYLYLQYFVNEKRRSMGGGSRCRFDIRVRGNADNARIAGFYDPTTISIKPLTDAAEFDWKFPEAHCGFTLKELNTAGGPELIFNLIQQRRKARAEALAELLDGQFWTQEASTTTDQRILSIFYHMPMITGAQVTAGSEGFIGGNPITSAAADFGDWGGLDRSSNARIKSWAAKLDNSDGTWTRDDVERIVRYGIEGNLTQPPGMDFNKPESMNLVAFTCVERTLGLGRLADSKNDAVGMDVAKFYGRPVINGIPVHTVSRWAAHTNTPFAVVNMSHWVTPTVQYMAESGPFDGGPEQHDLQVEFIDNQFMTGTDNPQRAGAMFANVTAA